MGRKVEVDEEVWAAIQAEAVPFEDTPNSALRRLLGIDPGGGQKEAVRPAAKRAAPGSILPESEYERPILRALYEAGGSAPKADAVERVGELLADRLTDREREPLTDGEERWRSRADFARLALRKRGLISSDSPRGVWELTDEGRRAAESAKEA